MNNINDTLKTIVNALEDKKAEDIQLIDIHEISTIADYFIITNGGNRSQIQAVKPFKRFYCFLHYQIM